MVALVISSLETKMFEKRTVVIALLRNELKEADLHKNMIVSTFKRTNQYQ